MGIEGLLQVIEEKGWFLKDVSGSRTVSWEISLELPKVDSIEHYKDYLFVPQSSDTRFSNGYGPCFEIDRLWHGFVDYRIVRGNILHFNRLYTGSQKYSLATTTSTALNKNPDACLLDNDNIVKTFKLYFRTIEPLRYAS